MRRLATITLEDATIALLKRISKKTDTPMSHLIESAVLEKYKKGKNYGKTRR